MLDHFKLQPRNVIERPPGAAATIFGFHCTSIDVLPVRPRVRNSNRLPIEDRCRGRLANLPNELVGRINFALIDLLAFGMKTSRRRLRRVRRSPAKAYEFPLILNDD
jgi:hypothetical protein